MTENELRQQVITQAQIWLGRREADGSHKEIIDVYNSIRPLPVNYILKYTDAWCAGFVSAVAQKLGLTGIIYPECGCDRMIALYKAHGRWMENDAYSAKPGDIAFYDWQDSGSGDNVGSADHVGIVAENRNGVLRVIEGNISDAVGYRSIAVNGRYIRGFGLPDYASVAKDADVPTTPEVPVEEPKQPVHDEKTFSLSFHYLRRGDGMGDREWLRSEVQTLQILLNGRGASVGKYGADGEFGPNTEAALLAYQRRRGLEADGVAGPKTFGSLFGI